MGWILRGLSPVSAAAVLDGTDATLQPRPFRVGQRLFGIIMLVSSGALLATVLVWLALRVWIG